MSQVYRSQNSVIALKELVENLNKNEFKSFNYDINENDFELLTVDEELGNVQDFTIFDQFNKFCINHLNKYTLDQLLVHNFFDHIHSFIYSCVISLINRENETKLANLLNSIDLIYEFLLKTSSIVQIKFESIDLFLLSTFNSFVQLCNFFKSQRQFSQKNVSLSQQNSKPDAKLSSQLIKISNLFETKIINLNEDRNKENLMKLNKYLIYLLKNFKDAKSGVFVWKMISRLTIKFKILLNNYDLDSDDFCQINGRFLLKKIFNLIYDDQSLNLNYIKDSLSRLSLNETSRISDVSNAIGSQMTLKNNIYLDTAKVIKLSAFMTKIFKSFISLYFNDLINFLQNDFFLMLTYLLSSINSILLTESRVNNDCLIIDTNQSEFQAKEFIKFPKEYYSIKLDFIKEFSSIYESLLQLIEANKDYANFMNKQSYFMDKINQTKSDDNDSLFPDSQLTHNISEIDQINSIDDILLFYLTFINRTQVIVEEIDDSKKTFNLVKSPAYLNEILNLAELSTSSYNLPTYILYNEQLMQKFDFSYLSSINYESGKMFSRIEFYDFLLIGLSKYIKNCLDQNLNTETLTYFLVNNISIVNNLIEENSQNQTNVYLFYSLRIKISCDLLRFIVKWLVQTNKPRSYDNLIEIIKFISEIYEVSGCSSVSRKNFYFKLILEDILDYCSQNCTKFNNLLVVLKEFYVNKRLFNCYNIMTPHLSKIPNSKKDSFIINVLIKTCNIYDEFIKLFKDKNKIPNEQIWIKKIIAFIDLNCFSEILGIIDDYFEQNEIENQSLISEQVDKLLKKVMKFLELNEIDNIGKYFDQFNEMKRKIDGKQAMLKQYSLNLENFKRIFQFICDSVGLFTQISAKSQNEDIALVLTFFIKHCSLKYETKIGCDKESTFLNIKFEAAKYLKTLAKRELDACLSSKILELFAILLNDSSILVKYFSLDCLDEYSKANESSNKIICQINRTHKNLSELIINYLVESSIDPNFDEINYYQDKRCELIEKLKLYHEFKDDMLMTQKLNAIEEYGGLDETMNAIMCAMDMTLSNHDTKQNSDSIAYIDNYDDDCDEDELESKSLIILENASNDLEKLFAMYHNKSIPESLKIKLSHLVKRISSFI